MHPVPISSAASDLDSLLEFSARIGREPLLVQAASGNTSVKLDGNLWIKASGKWLAHADREDILVPVNLAETHRRIRIGVDPAGQLAEVGASTLGTSVETAMHAVLPYRVVVHVHSVNTIAWAVRRNGATELRPRLQGLEWQWVPYSPSGLGLAAGVTAALERNPRACVFVLANHGLVVCGNDCDEAERLLAEVECRLAILPRAAAEPDIVRLQNLAMEAGEWRIPSSSVLHAAGVNSVSRRILTGGILYPCQAIFLTARTPVLPVDAGGAELRRVASPFVLIEGAGMLVREHLNPAEFATLEGLAQVARRIPEGAALEYLSERAVGELLCANVYQYRERVEDNSATPMPLARETFVRTAGARAGSAAAALI